jgi:hypothetical protein
LYNPCLFGGGFLFCKHSELFIFIDVIQLTKGVTQNIILTLTEKQLLTNPNYLFVFTNRSSNVIVKFVVLNGADTSLYKDRYNKFSIVTNTNFSSALNGQYTYEIYEQASTSNTNISGLNKLETGIMELQGTSISYTKYTTTNQFTIRQ